MNAVCEDGLPAAVVGDAGRVREVLLNLASNAVKFTERGSVTIGARCASQENGFATLVWTVLDTGIGINPRTA